MRNQTLLSTLRRLNYLSAIRSMGLNAISAGLILSLAGCLPSEESKVVSSSEKGSNGSFFAGAKSAVNLDGTRVQVSWDAPSKAVSSYVVYSVAPGGALTGLRTVPGNLTSTVITGLSSSTIYTFRVTASATDGTADTNAIDRSAITFAGITTAETVDSTTGKVAFPSMGQADQLNVYCSTTMGSFDQTPTAVVTSFTDVNKTINSLTPGTTYYCKVLASFYGQLDNNTAVQSFTPVGQATSIAFTTQPSSPISAGTKFNPGPVVKILDIKGNVVSAGPDATASVTLSISGSSPTSSAVITGSATVKAVKGVADFSNLIDIKKTGINILKASKEDTSSINDGSTLAGTMLMTIDSSSFTVIPGAISSSLSTILASPSSSIANGASAQTVTVTLLDQYANPIISTPALFISSEGANDTVSPQTITLTDSNGQISGSISTTKAGVRTLSVSIPTGISPALQTTSTFVPGNASKIVFLDTISDTPAASVISPFRIAVQDANNNIVTGLPTGTMVTLLVASGPSPTISPVNSPEVDVATTGIGTFSGVILNTATIGTTGTNSAYRLIGQRTGLTSVNSNPFKVTSGGLAKFDIAGFSATTAPTSNTCGITFTVTSRDIADGALSNPGSAQPFALSGLGSAEVFANTDTLCAAPLVSANLSIPRYSSNVTLRLRNRKAETINLQASFGSTTSNIVNFSFSPINLSFSPTTISTSPVNNLAGACIPITIYTLGTDNTAGPTVADVSFPLVLDNPAVRIYNLPGCLSGNITTNSHLILPAGQSSMNLWIQNNIVTTFTLTFSNASGITGRPLTFRTHPAKITLSGASSFPSGPSTGDSSYCNEYTVRLLNGSSGITSPIVNTTIQINAVGSGTLKMYTNNTCTSPNSSSRVTINTSGNQSARFYLIDEVAASINLRAVDSTSGAVLPLTTQSDILPVTIGAYQLRLSPVGPLGYVPGDCSQALTLRAVDYQQNPVIQTSPISLSLSIAGNTTNQYSIYSGSGCSGTALNPNSPVVMNGTDNLVFSIRDTVSETVNFSVSDPSAIGLKPSNNISLGFFAPPVATFNGWVSLVAIGAKVQHITATSMSNESRKVQLEWKPITLDNGAVDVTGYVVFRSSLPSSGFVALNQSNPVDVSGQLYYEDASANLSAGTTYYYKIAALVNGQLVQVNTPTLPSDLVVKIPMPPDNMSLIHRWAANIETCRLMGRETDRANNYRCTYTGPGSAVANHFDLGYSYFMDRFEAGCNVTSNNHFYYPTGPLASEVNDGEVLHIGPESWCQIKKSNVLNDGSPQAMADMYTNKPGVPPMTRVSILASQATCSLIDIGGGYPGKKILPSRKEHVIAAAPPKAGYSGCNSYKTGHSGYGIDNWISSNSAVKGLRIGLDILRTGSNYTTACSSVYGVQDLIGNAQEPNRDVVTSAISGSTTVLKADSISGTDLTSFSAEYVFGTVGPKCATTSNIFYSLKEGQCSAVDGSTLNKVIVPLGLPVLSTADQIWDGTLPGTSNSGALTQSMVASDIISLIPERSRQNPANLMVGSWNIISGGGRWPYHQTYYWDQILLVKAQGLNTNPGRYSMGFMQNNSYYMEDLGFRCMAVVPGSTGAQP